MNRYVRISQNMTHSFNRASLKYDDGLQFIDFNTKDKKGGSREIQTMLKCIEESSVENAVDDAIFLEFLLKK